MIGVALYKKDCLMLVYLSAEGNPFIFDMRNKEYVSEIQIENGASI